MNNEKIEQEADNILKRKLDPSILILNNPDYTFNKVIEAMKAYGDQRFNAALSEAMSAVTEHWYNMDTRMNSQERDSLREILEGLKIKP